MQGHGQGQELFKLANVKILDLLVVKGDHNANSITTINM